MGFWQVEGTSMIIGDGPVDIFERHMHSFSTANPKPDFAGFLAAARDALDLQPKNLRARFHPPASEVLSAKSADPALRELLETAVEEMRDEYDLALGRQPTTEELLATFAFPLRVRPEQFLGHAEGLRLRDIVME